MGTPYTKNTTWVSGGAPGIDAAALNNLETQFDAAKTYIDEILAQVDYQVYTTPGSATWTKPATCKWVYVICIGGGGGGQIAGISNAGGGGGGRSDRLLHAADLGATETVTVGAGGAANNNGGNSSFGPWVKGVGGKVAGVGGGPVANRRFVINTPVDGDETGMYGYGELGGGPECKQISAGSYYGVGGAAEKGGAGGGGTLRNLDELRTGQSGGVSLGGGGGGGGGGGSGYGGGAGGATGYTETAYGGGGSAGAADGNGGNGADGINGFCGQGGGGGGGSNGNGGSGGAPGGGGGGSGASGTPGAGGRGEVRVYTW